MDKLFERAAFWIERVLALAFIGAVVLNFVNVIARYLLAWSILSADEIQVFCMVCMTFLGAVVVTWRRAHLRMDVLIDACPPWAKISARVLELVLFGILAAFVLYQSFVYAHRMFVIGRTSDTAGIPMWIPHGAVALGF